MYEIKRKNSKDYAINYLSFLAVFLFFFNFTPTVLSQSTTAPKHRYFTDHNPTKALWMSAALPGLGQYYNQKYWKIPIVYAGFSTLAYFSIINRQEYTKYRDAYAIKLALNGLASEDPLINNYSKEQLLSLREYYQSNLELNYILFGAFYLLQMIDATVDAHFHNFDINDNLSIGIDPMIYQNQNHIHISPGVQLRFTLGKP
ncbi:MAG: DUF5683 domain-containing protein [Bacteroidota bacterium]|jgi:hypothetical protein